MKLALLPMLLGVALVLSGCASSGLASAASQANQKLEAEGLPFRWSTKDSGEGEVMVMHMLPLPVGQTRADAQLQSEIFGAIRQREQSKGRGGAEVQEVRPMADGREVWVLQSLLQGIAYVVSIRKSAQDVTNVELLGPYTFER